MAAVWVYGVAPCLERDHSKHRRPLRMGRHVHNLGTQIHAEALRGLDEYRRQHSDADWDLVILNPRALADDGERFNPGQPRRPDRLDLPGPVVGDRDYQPDHNEV